MVRRSRTRAAERGQFLIFFVAMFSIILIMATVVIDVGSYVADRRTSQKDADSAVLSGAIPLLKERTSPTMQTDAVSRITEWALRNGVDDAAHVINPRIVPQCWAKGKAFDGLPDGVETEIDAGSKLILGKWIADTFGGSLHIDVGAHARACIGSLVTTTGLRPWAMPQLGELKNGVCSDGSRLLGGQCITNCFDKDSFGNIVPLFGATCKIRSDQPQSIGSINLESTNVSGTCGSGNSSASAYENNILEGGAANCSIGDLVGTKQGVATGPTKQGMQDLLATEDTQNAAGKGCDAKFNTPPAGVTDNGNGVGGHWIDDFWEVFTPADAIPGPTTVYTARECDNDPTDLLGEPDSPRFVTVAMVGQLPTSNGTQDLVIKAFAGFFVERCQAIDNNGVYVPSPAIDEQKCTIAGSSFQIVGRFIQFQQLGGTGGPLNPFGTNVILLVE